MTTAPAGSNVIAVEMDSKQFDLLKINLDANKNLGEFYAIHAGLWNQSGEYEYSYEHLASHTLAAPDEHSHHTQMGLVRTMTLDEIIEESGMTSFDHVNLQTGGAEYETLRGFRATHERVATLWVGSHYRHDGVSERFRCQTLLRERGFDLYDSEPFRQIPHDTPLEKEKTGGFLACNPSKVNPTVSE
jgi:FkbM family methyltransferase